MDYYKQINKQEYTMFELLLPNKALDNYYKTVSERIDFEFNVDTLIMSAWKEGKIDGKYLSSYDRYLLEFKHLRLEGNAKFGLFSNIIIYNENLDVVYDAQFKTFKALNSSRPKGQMLLELEYWLSHDWKREL